MHFHLTLICFYAIGHCYDPSLAPRGGTNHLFPLEEWGTQKCMLMVLRPRYSQAQGPHQAEVTAATPSSSQAQAQQTPHGEDYTELALAVCLVFFGSKNLDFRKLCVV